MIRAAFLPMALLVVLATTSACSRESDRASAPTTPVPLGQQTAFSLVSNDGEPTPIPAPGRATVIEYWAPTCEPCSKGLPRIVRTRAALRALGAELVLVAILGDGESTELAEKTLVEWHVPGERFLVDRDQVSLREAAVTKLPTTQVFDAHGLLRWVAPDNAVPQDVLNATARFSSHSRE